VFVKGNAQIEIEHLALQHRGAEVQYGWQADLQPSKQCPQGATRASTSYFIDDDQFVKRIEFFGVYPTSDLRPVEDGSSEIIRSG